MVEFENDIIINMDGAIYRFPALVGSEGFARGSPQSGRR